MARRRFRKKVMRKRRRSKNIRKQTNDGKRFFKLKQMVSMTASGLGVVDSGVNDDPQNAQDWANVAALFDMYRVNAIKVKFIPSGNTAEVGVTPPFQPLYAVYDPDSASQPLTAINDAIQYENCKFKNMYRPWTLYHKMNRTLGTLPTVRDNKGYSDIDNPQPTQGIWWYGINFPANVIVGTLLVTYYITAKGRK